MWLAATTTLLSLVLVILGLAASLVLSVAQLATLIPAYQDSFTALAGVFSNMLFLLFVVAFMAIDATGFSRRLTRAKRQRADVVGAPDGFTHGNRSHLLVSTVFGAIVAAVDTGFIWLAGVPLPLLWGLLAFITNYIPNVGFLIGLLPPALLALLEGGPRLMVIVIVAYSVINFILQSVIQPKILADAVNLSLTLTFLSLVFWTFVIGPIGAARRPVDAADEGAAARRGPRHPMDIEPARRRARTARGRRGRRHGASRTRGALGSHASAADGQGSVGQGSRSSSTESTPD